MIGCADLAARWAVGSLTWCERETLEPVEGLDCWGMVAVTTMDLEIVGVSG